MISQPSNAMDVISHTYSQLSAHSVSPMLPPPRSYYVVSWVPRALPEVVQLVKELPNESERCLINKHFELGMLVMRRCGVQNPEEIKCLLDGFREGTTRLTAKEQPKSPGGASNSGSKSTDSSRFGSGFCCSPTVERRKLLIFFNDHRASRPWVLCPAKHCIKSARTTGKYVFATFCPQQKYTDHELEWFDFSRNGSAVELGGDQIFRELLEEHDTKGSRIWPFEDYIIFSNSLAKIVAVFKRRQPLLTLYRNNWSGLDECAATAFLLSSFVTPYGVGRAPDGSMLGTCMQPYCRGSGASPTACENTLEAMLIPKLGSSAKSDRTMDDSNAAEVSVPVEHLTPVQPVTAVVFDSEIVKPTGKSRSKAAKCPEEFVKDEEDDDEQDNVFDENDDDSDPEPRGRKYDKRRDGKLCNDGVCNRGLGYVPTSGLHCVAPSLPGSISFNSQNLMYGLRNGMGAVAPDCPVAFGMGMIPPAEFVQQADEAEAALIRMMTRVLAHFEPIDGHSSMEINFMAVDRTTPPTCPSKCDNPGTPDTDTPGRHYCSDEVPAGDVEGVSERFTGYQHVTSSDGEDGNILNECNDATTSSGSSHLESGENAQLPFGLDSRESNDYQRRKLDVLHSGLELENKRRKVISYPSPSNAVLYHELVRQFLSRLALGLDNPPMPQKRIPDTVKRVVTKLVSDSIKEINLALLTSSIRCSTETIPTGEDVPTAPSLVRGLDPVSSNFPYCHSCGPAAQPNGIMITQNTSIFPALDSNGNLMGQTNSPAGANVPPVFIHPYGFGDAVPSMCGPINFGSLFPSQADPGAGPHYGLNGEGDQGLSTNSSKVDAVNSYLIGQSGLLPPGYPAFTPFPIDQISHGHAIPGGAFQVADGPPGLPPEEAGHPDMESAIQTGTMRSTNSIPDGSQSPPYGRSDKLTDQNGTAGYKDPTLSFKSPTLHNESDPVTNSILANCSRQDLKASPILHSALSPRVSSVSSDCSKETVGNSNAPVSCKKSRAPGGHSGRHRKV